MRVLMLGWEFPPFVSGGLGTACYGLTKAMSRQGTEVIFVLPRPVQSQYASHVRMATMTARVRAAMGLPAGEFRHVSFRTIEAQLFPYADPVEYSRQVERLVREGKLLRHGMPPNGEPAGPVSLGLGGAVGQYTGDLLAEVHRYARMAMEISRGEQFDVIHAHDWMTYPAGLAVAAVSGKPLIVHIHSTEFDRSGENVNQQVYDIERAGLHGASRVIAVSHLTKSLVVSRYGVAADKVEVVYNAVEMNGQMQSLAKSIRKLDKIVLFLGRITMQKGPEYFLAAAKKVLDVYEDVKFVMAGTGDMTRRMIELSAQMGIGHKVLFTGFLRGPDVEKVFKMADLYVMPSVSEPFGIAPLEAISHDVPVIISKQSGVSEVLTHVLKVDFWDINELANKILAVLRHPPLSETLRRQSTMEVQQLTWDKSAAQVNEIYRAVSGD